MRALKKLRLLLESPGKAKANTDGEETG